jgi:cyclopropane fatty-acyl-phospholipid synthase-like methyltransferase
LVAQRYSILYRLGITPWEHDEAPEQLKNLTEGWGMRVGRALDIGCGTGGDAVYLAEQGWAVTAVDGVAQALSKAGARTRSAGVEVNWVQGDVCRLEELGIGEGFDLMLDRGCFHDFTDDQRDRYARAVRAVASPAAVLLMFAFQPRRRGMGPRGVTGEELMRHLGQEWELLSSTPDTEVRLPRWLGDIRPTWYRLQRRS